MKTLNECKQNIQEFANQHKIIFDDEGDCGFGRECIGLRSDHTWIAFNPYDSETYKPIEEYSDDRFHAIAPKDAYHKHDCIAVLGRGDKVIIQLSDWVDKLRELNVKLIEIPNKFDNMIQYLMSGYTTPTFIIPKEKHADKS